MTTELASPLQDKLGQELKPGVWIFYGHNVGTSAGLRLGKVMGIKYIIPLTSVRESSTLALESEASK